MPLSARHYSLLAIVLSTVGLLCFLPMIAQDPHYHQFADRRTLFGISNFFNVSSNLPFLLIGLYGMRRAAQVQPDSARGSYFALSCAIFLIGLGSAYYHLEPGNVTLLWDRLPMTLAFMALFSLLLQERLQFSPRWLWPLLACGLASATYWYWGELHGAGDLRPYLLVQYLPLLLTPLMLLLFPSRYLRNGYLWAALALYLLAKLCEHHDFGVLHALQWISGHSIKHLLAALAILCFVLAPRFQAQAKPALPLTANRSEPASQPLWRPVR